MNKYINALGYKLMPFVGWFYSKKIRKNFKEEKSANAELPYETFLTSHQIYPKLQVQDENWMQIKNIGKIMWNDMYKCTFMQHDLSNIINHDCTSFGKVKIEGNDIICQSNNKKNDWIFIKVPFQTPAQGGIVEFDAIINEPNSEFQIAFNYNGIGRRYRFNFKNNKVLSFEVVYKGCFVNDICSVPLSIEYGKLYNYQIVITKDILSFKLNGKVILAVNQNCEILPKGSFALILWDSKNSKINTTYKNLSVHKIITK